MPIKRKTKEKTEAWPFDVSEVTKDAQCGLLEEDDKLETLRFLKMTKLGIKGDMTSASAQNLINQYREEDALAFARTIKKLLTEKNTSFRDMLLENAEARLREHKNRK
jgi:hypothetical protein